MNQAMSSDTAAPAKVSWGRPFQKGHSGNPAGREPGVVRRIKRQTKGGRELVDRLLVFARGESLGVRESEVKQLDGSTRLVKTQVIAPARDQREALVWLLERLAGKPRQEVELLEQRQPFLILMRERPGSVDPLAEPIEAEATEVFPGPDLPSVVSPSPVRVAPAAPRNGPPRQVRALPSVGQVWEEDTP